VYAEEDEPVETQEKNINPHLKRHSGYRLMLPAVNETNCSDPELFDQLLIQILQTSGDPENSKSNLDRLAKFEESCRKLRKESRLKYLDAQNRKRIEQEKEKQQQKDSWRQYKQYK